MFNVALCGPGTTLTSDITRSYKYISLTNSSAARRSLSDLAEFSTLMHFSTAAADILILCGISEKNRHSRETPERFPFVALPSFAVRR